MIIDPNQLQQPQNLPQQGQLEAALDIYQQLHQQQPDNIGIIQLIALAYVHGDHLTTAKTFIKNNIKQLPNDPSLHNTLGNILMRQKKLTAAIHAYKTALQLNPNYISAFNNLGNVYQQQQQFLQATQCYESAIALDPNFAEAHFNLARLYLQQDLTEPAIQHLNAALTASPEHINALGQLGQIYLTQEKYELARDYLIKRIALEPDHAPSQQSLGMAYINLTQYEAAIACLEQALKLDPQLAETAFLLATALLLSGNRERAFTFYLRQLEQAKHLESFYNVGVILSDKQQTDDAIHYFKQAIAMDATYLPAHLNIAALYLKKNNIPDAIHHYQIAQTLNPNDEETQHILHALKQDALPKQAPTAYLNHLFDQYAPTYDQHLQEHLHYQVPTKLHALIIDTLNPLDNSLNILDLGCGTGLMGEKLQHQAQQLVGVDISEIMLSVAERKHIYHRLIKEPIDSALDHLENFNLVIAADVFPYIGDLKNIFEKVYRVLPHGGYFAFSIEKSEKDPYVLQTTIRYAHNKKYIELLSTTCGYTIKSADNVFLRQQQKKPIAGYLFILIKP